MPHVVSPAQRGSRRRLGLLPAEATGFTGRTGELAGIATLLELARLVTVTGPAGVGKTRLALRAAAAAEGRFGDGAWFVDLSGLRDPALLPGTVATALGLPERDGRPPRAAGVLDHLRGRNLLLILDTCEHLVDACAAFTEAVLRAAPGVVVLATSRQPLDAPGEHTYPVPPLPVTADGQCRTAGAAPRAGDAVELFAERAAAVLPGFTVTPANRADVIRLCRRLDGLPLAIELAAVRLRALPLAELADRVAQGFQALTASRRGATPRHQTLRAAVEWSYQLCTPAERALWARLSVFAGTFDMAAAEQVCADESLPAAQLTQALIGLVDKSVVLRAAQADGRYLLLHTMREFGAEKLALDGLHPVFAGRLTARCLALATEFDERFLTGDQVAMYHQLRGEDANIRAALGYALGRAGQQERPLPREAGLADKAGRADRAAPTARVRQGALLAVRLHHYWQVSGLLREGLRWLDTVIDAFGDEAPERGWALGVRGRLATFLGDAESALADLRESVRLAGALGEELVCARGYLYLNLALTFAGRHGEALLAAGEARRRMVALGHCAELVTMEAQLACLHQLAGDPEAAIERCERGLAMTGAESGERWVTSYLCLISGFALLQRPGREAQSADAVREALLAKHELGDVTGTAYALELLSWHAARGGRHEHAALLAGAADPLWERAGCRLGGIFVLERAHQRAVRRARAVLGDQRFAAVRAQGTALPLDLIVRRAIDGVDLMPPSEPGARSSAESSAGSSGSSAGSSESSAGSSGSSGSSAGLTRREQEIAAMVGSGLSNREIASQLFISKRTVDAHVEHIFSKLRISSRVQLALWLHDHAGAGYGQHAS